MYENQAPTAVAKKPRMPKTMPTMEFVSSPFSFLLLLLLVVEGLFEDVGRSDPLVLDPGLVILDEVDDVDDTDGEACGAD